MRVLVKNTTREERKNIIENAIALSSVGAEPLTKTAIDLYNQYIEGNMELTDVKKAIMAINALSDSKTEKETGTYEI